MFKILAGGWTFTDRPFLKLGMMIDKTKIYIFTSLNHFDHHSKSQIYKEATTCAVILL